MFSVLTLPCLGLNIKFVLFAGCGLHFVAISISLHDLMGVLLDMFSCYDLVSRALL